MKINNYLLVFLLFIGITLIFSCKKENIGIKSADKWVNLHVPYFGMANNIEFIDSKIGCIVGQAYGGMDSSIYNIILTTRDGGMTWHSIYLSHRFLIDTIGSMVTGFLYQYNSNIFFIGGSSNTLWYSDDQGDHWRKADVIHPPGSGSHFFDPAHGIAEGYGIYRTIDSGKTWKKVYKTDAFAFSFSMLQFTDRRTGYASGGIAFDGTNFGIMVKTTDGGNTWKQINYSFHDILSMFFINSKLGYVSMNMNSGTIVNGSKLLKTEDGGKTWSDATPPKGIKNDASISNLYFKNTSEGFCTIAGIIHHTLDGGKTWQKEYDKIVSILTFPDAHTGYAIDTTGSVLKREF